MSKKAKSKQPVRRKYVTAGALGYNQASYTADNFASPYSTNPFYYDAGAAMAGQQRMKAAMSASQALEERAREGNKAAEEARKEREQQLKEAMDQSRQAGVQGLQGVGMEAGATLATESAKKLAQKKALEEAAKEAAKQTGTVAAQQTATQAASNIGTQAAGQLSAQAVRGSGMAAAANLVDETGMVVLPSATKTASSIAASGAGAAGSTAAKAGILGANMSGLASAGIGLGLTGAGMLIEHKTTDYDPTTFTEKERKGNLWGSAIKGAGSGVGYGTMAGTFLPGVGNVVGAGVGALVGAGIGLAKGIKENKQAKKDAEEYAKQQAEFDTTERLRRERIAKQSSDIAGAYNSAFLQSRLTGSNQGIGYGAQNQAKTGGMMYGLGGYSVPGGQVVPIGQGAVEFVGRKHSQGGILLDPNTEVEGGETMDQVAMNQAKTGGKMNDYFFSAYLKLGGKSFAQRHKELIKSGASQAAIQDLAKKQEAVANKKGEKDRSPEQIAKYGGIHKYQTAGAEKPNRNLPEGYEWKQVMIDGKQEWSAEPIQPSFIGAKVEGRGAPEGTQWNMGEMPDGSSVLVNTPKKQSNKFKVNGPYLGSIAPQRTPSRRPGPDSTAAEQVNSKGAVTPEQSANAQSNKSASKTKAKSSKKKAEPAKSVEEIAPLKYLDIPIDKLIKADAEAKREAEHRKLIEANNISAIKRTQEQLNAKSKDTQEKKEVEKDKKDTTIEGDSVKDNFTTPSVLAGLAQLIPAGYVLATPYKKTAPIDTNKAEFRGQRVGVGATVRGATLGRVDSRQERAAAIANAAALNKYIEGTNAGPGAIIGKLAVNAKLNDQMLKIQDADNRANLQLRAKEAELGQAASTANAQMALQAASQSAENLQRASENLQKAKMFNAQMEMSEKQFADERKVASMTAAVRGVASTVGDVLSYRAQERLAKVIQESGEYDRFKLKELMDTDPAFVNLTQAQKNEIAARIDAADKETKNTQKLGGARRYTSRLGDLNRGKNKRNFNI